MFYFICLIFVYMEPVEHTIEEINVIDQDIENIGKNCIKNQLYRCLW